MVDVDGVGNDCTNAAIMYRHAPCLKVYDEPRINSGLDFCGAFCYRRGRVRRDGKRFCNEGEDEWQMNATVRNNQPARFTDTPQSAFNDRWIKRWMHWATHA